MFAKNGNVKYNFSTDFVLKKKGVFFRKLFYFLKVSLLSFIFV